MSVSSPSLLAATRSLCLARASVASGLHTTASVSKEQAGKYKVTLNRTKPLTYEMAMQPQKIASHKSWNRDDGEQQSGHNMHLRTR